MFSDTAELSECAYLEEIILFRVNLVSLSMSKFFKDNKITRVREASAIRSLIIHTK